MRKDEGETLKKKNGKKEVSDKGRKKEERNKTRG